MHPRTVIQLSLLLAASVTLHAQWQLQTSGTTASLRGITTVGNGIAWASGTEGTVLHTADGGAHWQHCPTPPGADHLDFRGIQAFDAQTAIVMSSGKGDLSRLYKTTDACETWKLAFTNPDKDGFWDALLVIDPQRLLVIGDPAHYGPDPTRFLPETAGDLLFRMRLASSIDSPWVPVLDPRLDPAPGTGLYPSPGESLFAASNSSVTFSAGKLFIGTSAGRIISIALLPSFRPAGCAGQGDVFSGTCGLGWTDWSNTETPFRHTTSTAGIFSLATGPHSTLVAVGGDYRQPDTRTATAAFTRDNGDHWLPAQTPPHGYRSSVAYDPTDKAWITVGPNGTDISDDDGRNWRALKPNPAAGDPPDADRDWNALALPFVVGPHGRIGKLGPAALKP